MNDQARLPSGAIGALQSCDGCGRCVDHLEAGYCLDCWGTPDGCTCGVSEPDEFGNRDLLTHPDCPFH